LDQGKYHIVGTNPRIHGSWKWSDTWRVPSTYFNLFLDISATL